MGRGRLVATLSLIVMSGLFGARVANACSCIGPFPEEWLDDSLLVFRGRVVGSRPVKDTIHVDGASKRHEASEVAFQILERFKGPSTSTYTVLYAECVAPLEQVIGGMHYVCIDFCSSHGMKKGQPYVVFAFKGLSGKPSTSDCSAYSMNDPGVVDVLERLRKRVSMGRRTTR
jgi:hypothetical protein